jgi:hypothetical protein
MEENACQESGKRAKAHHPIRVVLLSTLSSLYVPSSECATIADLKDRVCEQTGLSRWQVHLLMSGRELIDTVPCELDGCQVQLLVQRTRENTPFVLQHIRAKAALAAPRDS